MFKVRVIPCLDVKDGRVVKGVNFVDLRDAGDPVALPSPTSCLRHAELLRSWPANAAGPVAAASDRICATTQGDPPIHGGRVQHSAGNAGHRMRQPHQRGQRVDSIDYIHAHRHRNRNRADGKTRWCTRPR